MIKKRTKRELILNQPIVQDGFKDFRLEVFSNWNTQNLNVIYVETDTISQMTIINIWTVFGITEKEIQSWD